MLQHKKLDDKHASLLGIGVIQELTCKYNPQQIAKWILHFAVTKYKEWDNYKDNPMSSPLNIIMKLKESMV
jgi:hypothetical protein